MQKEQNIALLIDCDNVSHQAIDGVLNELANYGVVNIRRAYGDWTRSELRGWETELQRCAIRPVQQYAYTKGKNATDAAMIIDAMDLLYSQDLESIALMTSDSDFTPLAMRLKDSGLRVYGFGAQKTPEALVKACSKFIYTEKLLQSMEEAQDDDGKAGEEKEKKSRRELRQDTALVKVLRTAVEEQADEDGWSNFSRVSHYMNNQSFSSINYGYKRLSDLIRASDLFEIEMRKNNSVMYLKKKA